jgi:hypothetical protein
MADYQVTFTFTLQQLAVNSLVKWTFKVTAQTVLFAK